MAAARPSPTSRRSAGRQRRDRRPGAERPASGARGDGAAGLRGGDRARLSRDRADPPAAGRGAAAGAARLRAAEAAAGASTRPSSASCARRWRRRRGCGRAPRSTSRRAPRPPHIVERLEAMAARAQAVAMVAPDHPTVTAAVEALRDARRRRSSRCCRTSRPGCARAMSGVNNRKVGRTAAWMVARAARAAGQGRGLRRQPPLRRARAARDRVPRLLPRERAGVRGARDAGEPRDPADHPRGDAVAAAPAPGPRRAASSPAAAWRARSRRCARRAWRAAGGGGAGDHPGLARGAGRGADHHGDRHAAARALPRAGGADDRAGSATARPRRRGRPSCRSTSTCRRTSDG